METLFNIILRKQDDIAAYAGDANKFLPHSGTGYFYPVLLDTPIITFRDAGNRQGCIIQLVVSNNDDGGLHKRSALIVHERYPHSRHPLAMCGPSCITAGDCVLRDSNQVEFFEKITKLVNGEMLSDDDCTVSLWNDDDFDMMHTILLK